MQAGVDERIQLELGNTLGEVEVIAEDNRPASLDEIRNHFAESQVVIRRINSVQRVSDSLCAEAWFTSNPRIGWGKPRLVG